LNDDAGIRSVLPKGKTTSLGHIVQTEVLSSYQTGIYFLIYISLDVREHESKNMVIKIQGVAVQILQQLKGKPF